MIRTTLIAALLIAVAAFMQADFALSNGLCVASETTYFTCQTGNKRWIGLCGTLPGRLQYRFGTLSRVELQFPEKAGGGAEAFQFAQYSRFQTDRVEVTFRNSGVRYAIFDYSESRNQHAGVRVTNFEGKEQEFVCTGRVTSKLGELKESLRCDRDNALNGGNCP